MPLLPLHPRPGRPVRQLRKSTRPEGPDQTILRTRPLNTYNERIEELVLRPPQTSRPAQEVCRGEPEPPRERAKLQPKLDTRRAKTPLTNPRPIMGHPGTLQRRGGQDDLRLDGGSTRLHLRNKGVGRKNRETRPLEEVLARPRKPQHPLHRKGQHPIPRHSLPRTTTRLKTGIQPPMGSILHRMGPV